MRRGLPASAEWAITVDADDAIYVDQTKTEISVEIGKVTTIPEIELQTVAAPASI